ncbi:MAG: 50S ribosomal protein L18 [Chlamydiales bacterium]|nr:50S ribosomal protein L18 [Chlamydiales bacterium]
MESSQKHRNRIRKTRAMRVGKHVRGSQEKPRLKVIRSNTQVYVQLIDDEKSITLASTSTLSKDSKNTESQKKNVTSAKQLGLKIAELAKEKNVQKVVFDRGRYRYHGIVAAIADGAREGGLLF